jgi:small conductance mechanosensitive channel
MENQIFPEQLQPYAPMIVGIAYAIVLFVIGWVASKWAYSLVLRMLRSRDVDEALSRFLASIAQYLVLAAAVIIALEEVGVETTSLVALLATAGLAIGLALQGNLGHFASGAMILFFRPFTLGDRITAGGQTGKVDDIGLFATTMLTPDNETIIVPNSTITSDAIVNYTVRETRRASIEIGIAYGADVGKAVEVMLAACKRSDLVLDDPAPAIAFVGFGASSLDFVVRPWATASDFVAMQQNVRIALYEDLEAAGIEIPFDQIVVHQAG